MGGPISHFDTDTLTKIGCQWHCPSAVGLASPAVAVAVEVVRVVVTDPHLFANVFAVDVVGVVAAGVIGGVSAGPTGAGVDGEGMVRHVGVSATLGSREAHVGWVPEPAIPVHDDSRA